VFQWKLQAKENIQESRMRIYLLLLVAMTSLSACALTPYPTSGDKNQITVYQPYIGQFDREKARHAAEEHCKRYGRKARLKADQGKKIVFECY